MAVIARKQQQMTMLVTLGAITSPNEVRQILKIELGLVLNAYNFVTKFKENRFTFAAFIVSRDQDGDLIFSQELKKM